MALMAKKNYTCLFKKDTIMDTGAFNSKMKPKNIVIHISWEYN